MAVNNGLPQEGFNGGLVTREFKSPYSNLKHTEANSVAQWFGGDASKTFLGILKPWNMTRYVSTPLINMTELSGNVLEVNGHDAELEFAVPYRIAPARIRGVYSGDTSDKLGINESVFFVELDRNTYVPDDVLTTKLRDGIQFRVVGEKEFYGQPVVEPVSADTWKYAVKLVTLDSEDFVTPDMLPVGIPVTKIGNYSGEFDTNRTGVEDLSPVGLYTLRTNVSIPEMGIEHHVTSWGDSYVVESNDKSGKYGMSQYSLSQQEMVTEYLKGSMVNNIEKGKTEFRVGARTWVPTIIKMMTEQLAYMKERSLMWQKPFIKTGATGKKQRIPAGYYWWIKEFGNYDTYSDFSELPNVVRYLASKVFSNARMLQPIDRKLRIKTGTGGAIELYKWFTDAAHSQLTKFLVVNDGQNPFLKDMIGGKDVQNLSFKTPRFISGHFPELGYVEVVVDPVLDFIDEDHEFQGRTGLYNNSSYMIFMEDITSTEVSNRAAGMPADAGILPDTYNKGSNVLMIKTKGHQDTTSFIPGTGSNPTLYSYFGQNPKSQLATTTKKGFTLVMDTCGALYVKDATKVVLIEYVPKQFTPKAF